ncbi:hypothetical protein ADL06_11205 [Streptomyces sp. NRRL F-6491]|nr:hypothetical protein ADL06_11205 [Streptomyces sp. NRRL F-6491]KOX38802.1 hypothetical protein ADL08_26185 [Streptomyces sp. NRRL F-6492]
METLGYAIAAVVWGSVAMALLAGVVATVLTVRWRRRAIAALESEELAAEGRQAPGRPDISP